MSPTRVGLISAVAVALIGAAATVVAAIISQGPSTSEDTSPPTTSMPSSTATPQLPIPPVSGNHANVQFTAPPDGFEIEAEKGEDVSLVGTVTGLGTDTLWILSQHSSGRSYYMVPLENGGISPVAEEDGNWHVTDYNVGDASDRGGQIIYYALQANSDCSRELLSKDEGDSFRSLPGGCNPVKNIKVSVR